jgi:hypothetical protein
MGEYSFGLHFFRSAIAGQPYCTGFVRPNTRLEMAALYEPFGGWYWQQNPSM